MSDSTFRVIIVGTGAIARVAHMPAAIASAHVELVGVVDPDIERAKRLCRDYGISPEVAASAEALGCSFDGAIVATPNDLHASVAKTLLEGGVPVLIEKPIATSVAAAGELVALAQLRDVVCAVGYHTRHSGACRALKQTIEAQQFGRTLGFAHQDGSRGGWSPLSNYNLDSKRAGGGVLVTTGTHFLDRLIWLWGMPSSLEFRDNGYNGPESHCIARFNYAGDAGDMTGRAFFSKVVNLAESTVVETEEGLLLMGSDAAEHITFRPHANPSLEYQVKPRGIGYDPRGLYQRQLEDFAHACQSGQPVCVDGATGALPTRLVADLYAAREYLGQDQFRFTGS